MRRMDWRLTGVLLAVVLALGSTGFLAQADCTCIGDDCFEDVIVSGAMVGNGTYQFVGMVFGRPGFSCPGAGAHLQFRPEGTVASPEGVWRIRVYDYDDCTELFQTYAVDSAAATPPSSGWVAICPDCEPAPSSVTGGESCSWDTTPPVLTVPPDVTIECDESQDPSNTGQATATDDYDPNPVITYVDQNGAYITSGFCRRTWQATDSAGNVSTGIQYIYIACPEYTITDYTSGWINELPATVHIAFTFEKCAVLAEAGVSQHFPPLPTYWSSYLPVTSDGNTINTFPVEIPADAPEGPYYEWSVVWLRTGDVPYRQLVFRPLLRFDVDVTPPTDPAVSSTTHTVGVVTNDPAVAIAISGAADAVSGVDGFEVAWDQSATWTPSQTKAHEETWSGDTFTATSEGDWYFHLATVDNAGNWTGTVHFGPFKIRWESSITNVQLSPVSPAGFCYEERVEATFNYSTDYPGDVLIFFRPVTGDYTAHGSPLYPTGSGSGAGWFTMTEASGPTIVNQVRIQMKTTEQLLLAEVFVDVDYGWGPLYETTPPVLTLPPDTSVECDESTDPSNTGYATAKDNCDPSPVVTYSDRAMQWRSACNSFGTYRDWTATDAAGNVTTGTQTICYPCADYEVIDFTGGWVNELPAALHLTFTFEKCAYSAVAILSGPLGQFVGEWTPIVSDGITENTLSVPLPTGSPEGTYHWVAVQLHWQDASHWMQMSLSPGFPFGVDVTPATDPAVSSTTHTVGVVTNDPAVAIAISGAADAVSGVDGFEVAWDQSATWTPSQTKAHEETWSGDTFTATSNGDWYFHLATADNAGNWTGTIHLGPFPIILTRTLTTAVNPPEAGSVLGAGTHLRGISVEVSAAANRGYRFGQWSGDASGTANPFSIVMDADKTVTAEFIKTYVLRCHAMGGTVRGLGTYDAGTSVEIEAVPAPGYLFDRWLSGPIDDKTNPRAVVEMSRDISVYVRFYRPLWLSVTAEPGVGGTVGGDGLVQRQSSSGFTALGSYRPGESVTLEAKPSPGYAFIGWYPSLLGTANRATIQMRTSMSVRARFARMTNVRAYASPPSGGTVQGAGTYVENATVKLTAVPREGYRLSHWAWRPAGSYSNRTSNSNPLITPASGSAMTFTAVFVPDTVRLSTSAAPYGAGQIAGAGTYPRGTEVEVTATPAAGYQFSYWNQWDPRTGRTVNVGSANPRVVMMDSDKRMYAVFTAKLTTISVEANPAEGGHVTGAGSYNPGTHVTLTARPTSGYRFAGWYRGSTSPDWRIIVGTNDWVFTAQFVPVGSYLLSTATVPPQVGGSISLSVYSAGEWVSTSDGPRSPRETIRLFATPSEGYDFAFWVGTGIASIDSRRNPLSIRIGRDTQVIAVFAKK